MSLAVIVLCAVGLFFSLTGAVGILRMPDVYTRIQCSSKVVTMGALPLLIGLAIAEGPITEFAGRALFVGFFVLVLSPSASHALARSSYKTDVPMWRGSVLDEPRQTERDQNARES
jgi:multicomponent Na+:H+ antiporter subunit G